MNSLEQAEGASKSNCHESIHHNTSTFTFTSSNQLKQPNPTWLQATLSNICHPQARLSAVMVANQALQTVASINGLLPPPDNTENSHPPMDDSQQGSSVHVTPKALRHTNFYTGIIQTVYNQNVQQRTATNSGGLSVRCKLWSGTVAWLKSRTSSSNWMGSPSFLELCRFSTTYPIYLGYYILAGSVSCRPKCSDLPIDLGSALCWVGKKCSKAITCPVDPSRV